MNFNLKTLCSAAVLYFAGNVFAMDSNPLDDSSTTGGCLSMMSVSKKEKNLSKEGLTIKDLQREKDNLQQQNADLQRQIERIQQARREERRQFQQEIDRLQPQNADLQRQMETLQQQIETLQQQNADLQRRNEQLEHLSSTYFDVFLYQYQMLQFS